MSVFEFYHFVPPYKPLELQSAEQTASICFFLFFFIDRRNCLDKLLYLTEMALYVCVCVL